MKKIYLILTGIIFVIVSGIFIFDKEENKKNIDINANKNKFTILIDGTEVDEMPATGSYTGKYNLVSYQCDKGSTLTWDTNAGTLSTTIISTSESCSLNFEEIKFTNQAISYSGSPVKVTLYPGTYKLEVWGASGGGGGSYSNGGKGGYSTCNYTVTSNTDVYVVVGGQGTAGGSTSSIKSGGYNGGGNSGYGLGGSGGGATHIATKTGILSSLSSYTSTILLVAGGGGGGANVSNYSGGVGGGSSGGNGTGYSTYYAKGGSQSAGGARGGYSGYYGTAGSFGQGGAANTGKNNYNKSGGGGGGYYGGGGSGYRSGNYSLSYYHTAGGGGGSGFYSTASSVTNGSTTAGSSSFASTSGGTETGHSGNGYAKITFVS